MCCGGNVSCITLSFSVLFINKAACLQTLLYRKIIQEVTYLKCRKTWPEERSLLLRPQVSFYAMLFPYYMLYVFPTFLLSKLTAAYLCSAFFPLASRQVLTVQQSMCSGQVPQGSRETSKILDTTLKIRENQSLLIAKLGQKYNKNRPLSWGFVTSAPVWGQSCLKIWKRMLK